MKKWIIFTFIAYLVPLSTSSGSSETASVDQDIAAVERIMNSRTSTKVTEKEGSLREAQFDVGRLDKSCSGNTVLKIQRGQTYVLKLFEGSSPWVEREILITKLAGSAGISPKVHTSRCDNQISHMLVEYLKENPLSSRMSWMRIDWEIMEGVIDSIRRLHTSHLGFPPTRTWLEDTRDFFQLITKFNIPVPIYWSYLRETFDRFVCLISSLDNFVPCHFDLHEENIFIDNEKVIKFIDWDCGGIGNLYLELAAFSLNFRFTDEEDVKLIARYFGAEYTFGRFKNFNIAKTLAIGFWSAREFVRPYFSVITPYSHISPVSPEAHLNMGLILSKTFPSYEELVYQARKGVFLVNKDIEVGVLMLQEYCRRSCHLGSVPINSNARLYNSYERVCFLRFYKHNSKKLEALYGIVNMNNMLWQIFMHIINLPD